MPNIRWLLAIITAVHRWVFRVSGGRIGGRWFGFRFLLLEHVGRQSGIVRKTPLLYVEDGDRLVIAASNMGDDRHPAWYLNLRKTPRARVELGTEAVAVMAREASDAEAEALWPKLEASYRWFDDYRRKVTRQIPVVILEPVGD